MEFDWSIVRTFPKIEDAYKGIKNIEIPEEMVAWLNPPELIVGLCGIGMCKDGNEHLRDWEAFGWDDIGGTKIFKRSLPARDYKDIVKKAFVDVPYTWCHDWDSFYVFNLRRKDKPLQEEGLDLRLSRVSEQAKNQFRESYLRPYVPPREFPIWTGSEIDKIEEWIKKNPYSRRKLENLFIKELKRRYG
jgi:hypothetical protein